MIEIKGIISPILTPMHEDESLNEEELKNQINRLIDAGIHGIFPFGTNGEGYILSRAEKERILQIVVDEVGGRVPVYAGTGCISTKETIELSLFAQDTGADVLSIITPSFAKASQEEMYMHYETVARHVDMPIILYNIPARTGNSLEPATVKRLSEIDQIVGIKDSSGDFNNMLQYLAIAKGDDFTVLSGNDALILWNLLAGGAGGIAGCSNVYPETMVGIYENFMNNQLNQARELQDSIQSFRDCFKYGNPNTIVKTATQMLGYPVGNCRKPFQMISDAGIVHMKQVLNENQLLGMR